MSGRIVASLDHLPIAVREITALAGLADVLEVRAERIGDVDPAWLRAHFAGELLYTLRAHDGDDPAERQRRLRAAADHYDLVAIEHSDLTPALLDAIPAHKRLLAWHGAADADELRARLNALTATPARLYLLTIPSEVSGVELAAPRLLRAARRRDVTAFATGPHGLWTRIVAPHLGAPLVFGRAAERDGDSTEATPSVSRLVDNFGFPEVHPVEELFGMVGAPVQHSLSPRIHNAAFRAIGRPALYVPFHVEDFGAFWTRVIESGAMDDLGLPVRGLSIVSPHKPVAVAVASEQSPMVRRAGATNMLVRADGNRWTAETTDADGIMLTLRERGVECRRKRVAVIGCGGSGRAMAAALHRAGGDVTMVNRGTERGSLAVDLLHLPFQPLSTFSPEPFSIIVNATPVGREGEEPPFAADRLRGDAVVVDLVYRQSPTPLIAKTHGQGRIAIDGWDMLTAQASRQFELMTGRHLPDGLAHRLLGLDPEREARAAR